MSDDSRVAFVLRGPQGAGKSTMAKRIQDECSRKRFVGNDDEPARFKKCSADFWFYIDGKYKYDKHQLTAAHDYCKGQFLLGLHNRCNVVLVDNTNLREDHCRWYIRAAQLEYYDVYVLEWKCENKEMAKLLAERSPHVPDTFDLWERYEANWQELDLRVGDRIRRFEFEPSGLDAVSRLSDDILRRGYGG
jgi:predicted kinase